MKIRFVLFDLDGTFSDSVTGILGSLRRAFDDVGVARLDPRTERGLLGPPFYESLAPIVGTDLLPRIIERYRTHYATRMYETEPYEGILEVLADLQKRGIAMAVATSKPEFNAEPIVEHLGMEGFFATVGGDTLDGARSDKQLVVGEVLRRLGEPDPGAVVMVGDRSHDVHGAHAHRIACLGAGWGYGGLAELVDAGASEVFATPLELLAAHDRLFGDA